MARFVALRHGSYLNRTEEGDAWLCRPSAILYRAGTWHQNWVGECGFEQVEIEFDPDWLGGMVLPELPASRWTGGAMGALSRTFALLCAREADEQAIKSALIRSFHADRGREPAMPAWLPTVETELRRPTPMSIEQLARRIQRHPFWIGQAYRRATGETLRQTRTRVRVERAAKLLRETADEPASIAIEAGFCDQSHRIRAFRRLLDPWPSAVRGDVFRATDGG